MPEVSQGPISTLMGPGRPFSLSGLPEWSLSFADSGRHMGKETNGGGKTYGVERTYTGTHEMEYTLSEIYTRRGMHT